MLMGVRDLLCHWVDPSFVLLFLCGVYWCETPVESFVLFLSGCVVIVLFCLLNKG